MNGERQYQKMLNQAAAMVKYFPDIMNTVIPTSLEEQLIKPFFSFLFIILIAFVYACVLIGESLSRTWGPPKTYEPEANE